MAPGKMSTMKAVAVICGGHAVFPPTGLPLQEGGGLNGMAITAWSPVSRLDT